MRGPDPECADPLVARLPHRPPFRFVDRVVAMEPGRSVAAEYRVTGDEALLAGHFPGRPIFPGVLIVEALAQAGAILLATDADRSDGLALLGGVDKVRIRRQVVPGDLLRLEVEIESLTRLGGRARGTASVEGARTASAQLLFVIVDDN